MAVLVDSVLAVAGLRNFSCVKLGTNENLQVLLVFLLCLLQQHLSIRLELI